MIKILYDLFTFPSHSVHQVLHEWSHKHNIRQRVKICGAPHSIAHFPSTFQCCVLPSSAIWHLKQTKLQASH